MHQTTGLVFSIHRDGYSPPFQLHLTDQRAVSFSVAPFFFPAATSIKSEDRFIMQVYNLGCGVVNFLIVGICQSTGPQYRPPQERVKTLVD